MCHSKAAVYPTFLTTVGMPIFEPAGGALILPHHDCGAKLLVSHKPTCPSYACGNVHNLPECQHHALCDNDWHVFPV